MFFTTKKMKYIFSIVIISLVAFAVVFWILSNFINSNNTDPQLQTMAANMEALGADIIVLGNLEKPENTSLNFRKVDKLNAEILSEKGYDGYHLIVLYDCDGMLSIDIEDVDLIKEYCEEKHFDLIYLGEEHIKDFYKLGLIIYEPVAEYSFFYNGYRFRDGNPYSFNGETWVNEITGAFNSNPFIIWGPWSATSYPGNKATSSRVWSSILNMALYSINN